MLDLAGRRAVDLNEQVLLRRLTRIMINAQSEPPESLASAAYMYEARAPILDHLTRLVHEAQHGPVAIGALIPPGAKFGPQHLAEVDPRKLMMRFRSELNRVDAAEADGYLFATLHGEFCLSTGHYHPHQHFIATGQMIEALERLRSRGKYQIAAINASPSGRDTPALQLRKLNLDEARYALSYLFQHFWPARWSGLSDDGRKLRGDRRRIPEPFHSAWLAWMHRQRLQDFALLMHLDVRREGLVVVPPKNAYFNGGGI
ncbi:hypothetical protein BFL28_09045 [Sphingomonas turrisvirgatae]|uniref:Uncharacterized protein n=1 Tax=Sphingomonas turrisvirgatae TaxID=1888892 RepID=A0A1E3M1A2_9SPHN|nr:hypothetical protein BFL28_09045 [Sphingomonas turrisvirgatae]